MFEPTLIIAGAALVGLTIVAAALKREELDRHPAADRPDSGSTIGAARIELADLKERIKKLEAIASGVDL